MWMKTKIVTSHIVSLNTQPSLQISSKSDFLRVLGHLFFQAAFSVGSFSWNRAKSCIRSLQPSPFNASPQRNLPCTRQWVFSHSAGIFKGSALPGNGYFMTFGWVWQGGGGGGSGGCVNIGVILEQEVSNKNGRVGHHMRKKTKQNSRAP